VRLPSTSVTRENDTFVSYVLNTVGPDRPLAGNRGVEERTVPASWQTNSDVRLDDVVAAELGSQDTFEIGSIDQFLHLS
jgi:hypothetical protein